MDLITEPEKRFAISVLIYLFIFLNLCTVINRQYIRNNLVPLMVSFNMKCTIVLKISSIRFNTIYSCLKYNSIKLKV